jgi:hypothetical protein
MRGGLPAAESAAAVMRGVPHSGMFSCMAIGFCALVSAIEYIESTRANKARFMPI